MFILFYFSFSNLFSGTERPNDPLSPYLNMTYSNSDVSTSHMLNYINIVLKIVILYCKKEQIKYGKFHYN